MASSNEKGNALEYAVHCIEEVMHRNVPGLPACVELLIRGD